MSGSGGVDYVAWKTTALRAMDERDVAVAQAKVFERRLNSVLALCREDDELDCVGWHDHLCPADVRTALRDLDGKE